MRGAGARQPAGAPSPPYPAPLTLRTPNSPSTTRSRISSVRRLAAMVVAAASGGRRGRCSPARNGPPPAHAWPRRYREGRRSPADGRRARRPCSSASRPRRHPPRAVLSFPRPRCAPSPSSATHKMAAARARPREASRERWERGCLSTANVTSGCSAAGQRWQPARRGPGRAGHHVRGGGGGGRRQERHRRRLGRLRGQHAGGAGSGVAAVLRGRAEPSGR